MPNDHPVDDFMPALEAHLAREGGHPPARPPLSRVPWRWYWLLLPLLLLLGSQRLLQLTADWFWYDSLGLTAVFWTRLWTPLLCFGLGLSLAWSFFVVNVWVAHRLQPDGWQSTPLAQLASTLGIHPFSLTVVAGTLIAGWVGASTAARWEDVLLFFHQQPFGLADPLFARDVSFFLFTLPLWTFLRTWLLLLSGLTWLAVTLVTGFGWRSWTLRQPALLHLALLNGLILVLIAWHYQLQAYQLVYSERGPVFGATYTDVHVQLPIYQGLGVITLGVAVLALGVTVRQRGQQGMGVVVVLWVVVAFVAGHLYPRLFERFQVSPNQLTLERPYLAHNIEFTRAAFDLTSVERQTYVGDQPLTVASVRTVPETLTNIRLWDYQPLLSTYNQLQALTQYYTFNDIDIDRYAIEGQPRQVLLAARELVPAQLPAAAQTWVNRKLVYTHGYGVAVSPVSQVTADGLPTFLLKDLPPQGVLPLTQPQIYFGELTNEYVIARTRQPEFDYPHAEGAVTTHFAAETGIPMRFGARLAFALYFADLNLLLNQDITAASQLLWRRHITERVRMVAPFLQVAADPYIVISEDGRLYWFQDAYITSQRFPYSEPVAAAGGINYMRNSIKIVTNAYDGSMQLYVMEEDEPITAAYQAIFPTLFTSFRQMPPDLQQHIRYPAELFSVQAEVYRTYHMTDTNEFYNQEDVWAWPQEVATTGTVRMEPNYVLMTLPGSAELNFIQMLPFTPANRENLVAWLAVHNDPEQYGQKQVYVFGKDTLFYGPNQIEARINQDPVISTQLSLWQHEGNTVLRGNLLVIPLPNSLLYVEPLYLQAVSGRMPELKRVILATAERVVMAETLGAGLMALVGPNVLMEANLTELAAAAGASSALGEKAEVTAASIAEGVDASLPGLLQRANTQYTTAVTRVRHGDWAGYAEEIEALGVTLQQVLELTGGNAALTVTSPLNEGASLPMP